MNFRAAAGMTSTTAEPAAKFSTATEIAIIKQRKLVTHQHKQAQKGPLTQ
jgi:hypothetical protein